MFGPSTATTGLSGDELYGVEPASYYIKNLLLTTSVCFPLGVLLLPVTLALIQLLYRQEHYKYREKTLLSHSVTLSVIWLCSVLWMGVLFKRPHKVSDSG